MKRITIVSNILLLAALLLANCAPQIQTVEVTRQVPATVEVTRLVEVTRAVEITRLVVVTATAVPVTPTPVFERWTAEQVIEAFKTAGLDIGQTTVMTDADYAINPARAPEAIRFLVPSLGVDKGGRVFAFDDPTQLKIGEAYFVTLGENNRAFFSWTFVRDNILVQINGDLPEEQARKFEKALNEME